MWILGHDFSGHYNRLALLSVDIISGAYCINTDTAPYATYVDLFACTHMYVSSYVQLKPWPQKYRTVEAVFNVHTYFPKFTRSRVIKVWENNLITNKRETNGNEIVTKKIIFLSLISLLRFFYLRRKANLWICTAKNNFPHKLQQYNGTAVTVPTFSSSVFTMWWWYLHWFSMQIFTLLFVQRS